MIGLPAAINLPLHEDEFGTIRVGNTRVSLESVILDHRRGSAPEEIVRHFSVLDVTDVYHVIGYYLAHRAEIDAYVEERITEGERLRHEWEQKNPPPLTRDELKAKYEAKRKQKDEV